MVIGKLRLVMGSVGKHDNTGLNSNKELKIELERCFLEMRKEFDFLCSEKFEDD